MVRPLHRWKSFWSGIIVLVFLSWSWVRSMGHRDEIAWESGSQVIAAVHVGGKVTVFRLTDYPAAVPGFHHGTAAIRPGQPWFPRGEWAIGEIGGRVTEIGIPHWLLMLGFVVPWAGFLAWRILRVKRLAGNIPATGE